jgi:hypothetical protein
MEGGVRVWWSKGPRPGNLGDVLTPVILAGLGVEAEWAPLSNADMIATGSVARFARKGQAVWGSGLISARDTLEPGARWLAVRGPLTAEAVRRAGGHVDALGDPALLLPTFHNGPVEQVHELGVVPHYIDEATRRSAAGLGLRVIEPLSPDPLSVVDQIRACRAIVSSSLHGIIVAHAYGIPAAWLACGRLTGDGVKFRDYAASVGVDLHEYLNMRTAFPILPSPIDCTPLTGALLGAGCAP